MENSFLREVEIEERKNSVSTKNKYLTLWTLRDLHSSIDLKETLQEIYHKKVYTRTIQVFSSFELLPHFDLFEILVVSDSLKDCLNLYKDLPTKGSIYYNGSKVDLRNYL